MARPLNLSVSQAGTFTACQRKWFYGYRKRWRDDGSIAADFGSAWHAAMDVVWLHATSEGMGDKDAALTNARNAFDRTWGDKRPEVPEDEWRGVELGHDMLELYVAQNWERITGFELLGVETSFKVPLTSEVNAVGRIDKVFRDKRDGRVYVVDHKTCSAYSKADGIRPQWWESFLLSPQVAAYILATRESHPDATFGGFVVDAALVHKTVRHFERRLFNRTDGQMQAYKDETLAIKAGMDAADAAGIYPKNLGACNDFGGCPFAPLCYQFPSVKDLPQDPPEWLHGVYSTNTTTEQRLGISTGGKP